MYTYTLIYILICFFSVLEIKQRLNKNYLQKIFLLFLIFFVGLRDKVGGDWNNYLNHFERLKIENFLQEVISWDPGYVLIEYIAKYLGLGIYGVNVICASLFFINFYFFIKTFRLNFFFSLLIAYPYFILVVVNGYTRQSVAIGFIMGMISFLYRNNFFKALLLWILAAFFHKTAVVFGTLFLLNKNFVKRIYIYPVIFSIIILYGLNQDKIFYLVYRYVSENSFYSYGFWARFTIFSIVIFLLFSLKKKLETKFDDINLWFYQSILILFIGFFIVLTDLTTIGDRFLLYFYPFQIIIFQRVFYVIENRYRLLYFSALCILGWAILIIWLMYSLHAKYWIPYNNILLEIINGKTNILNQFIINRGSRKSINNYC